MKKIYAFSLIVFLCFLFVNTKLHAQIENSAYSATGRGGVGTTMLTDYQALGVNPANIAIRKSEMKNFTIGFMEFSGNTFLQGVSNDDLNKYVRDENFFKKDSLNFQERIEAARFFSGKAFGMNIDVMPLGVAFNNDKIGSFAFNVRESIRYFMDYNLTFTDYAFNGARSDLFPSLITNSDDTVANDPNMYASYFQAPYGGIKAGYNPDGISVGRVMDNSSFKLHWTREWALGYGRKIFELEEMHYLYAGITVKYVQGFGYVDIQSSGGKLKGIAAYMPALNQMDSLLQIERKEDLGNSYKSIGHGMGFDFGLTAVLFNNIRVGASLINLGSVTYNQNVYDVSDTTFYSVAYNSDFLSGFDEVVKWRPRDNVKVKLPTQFRLGASVSLLDKRIEVGIDMVKPLNKEAGNYNKTAWGVGADFYPLKWLRLSTGGSIGGNLATSSGGNYRTRFAVPFGAGVVLGEDGTFEIGIATRDVTTYFMGQSSPLYSFAMGLVRARF